MKKLKNAEKKIAVHKHRLILKAKKSGIYENFGQTEVRKLEDEYSFCQYGDEEERNIWKSIIYFEEWCINYTGD